MTFSASRCWPPLAFSLPFGVLEYVPTAAAGLSYVWPLHSSISEGLCKSSGVGILESWGNCNVLCGFQKLEREPSHSASILLGLCCILHLETKRHCLEEQPSLLLPFFICFLSQQAPGHRGNPAHSEPSVTHAGWQPFLPSWIEKHLKGGSGLDKCL